MVECPGDPQCANWIELLDVVVPTEAVMTGINVPVGFDYRNHMTDYEHVGEVDFCGSSTVCEDPLWEWPGQCTVTSLTNTWDAPRVDPATCAKSIPFSKYVGRIMFEIPGPSEPGQYEVTGQLNMTMSESSSDLVTKSVVFSNNGNPNPTLGEPEGYEFTEPRGGNGGEGGGSNEIILWALNNPIKAAGIGIVGTFTLREIIESTFGD